MYYGYSASDTAGSFLGGTALKGQKERAHGFSFYVVPEILDRLQFYEDTDTRVTNIFMLPLRGEKKTHRVECMLQILLIFVLFGILTGSKEVSRDPSVLLVMGISWIILTLVSETLVFHFFFRIPVSAVLAQYIPGKGYLNILVLVTMVIAPLFWGMLAV